MKRLKSISLMIFGLILLTLISCEPIESCKNCEAVTYEAGTSTVIDRQDGVEYCGNDLLLKETTSAMVIGSDSTVWECN